MYQKHPDFPEPANENIKIWRYMDFTKFVSLITTSKLFFARADKFDDSFEGSYPLKTVENRDVLNEFCEEEHKQKFSESKKVLECGNKKRKEEVAINCWHQNDCESAAMWRLY